MKRDLLVRKFCEFLTPSDIAVFGSNSISAEVSELYKPGHFYILDSSAFAVSFALGLAMSTPKRVFVFIGEGDILRNFGIINQISSSKCQNLFVIILNNGCYQDAGGFPNIFNNAISILATIFNIGCRTFNLTKDFDRKEFKHVNHFFDRGQGPMVVIVGVEKSKSNYDNTIPKNDIREFIEFVRDNTIASALYNPFAEGLVLDESDIRE
jgi:thiamine pyrophosphate-dependent acetolactate synthase large subunit-like protein